jgi:two-component system sensor histidine kinase BaeS
MNRLAPRLALAMIATTILSILILVASVQFADYQNYWSLPSEVRAQVPPPRLDFLSGPPKGKWRDTPEYVQETPPANDGAGYFREQARLFESRRTTQERMLLIGMALAAGLTVLLAFLLSRSIARPIAAVSKAARGVANGDFSARVSLTERQKRSSLETDTLAVTFNRMSEALEAYEHERKAMVADIAHELRTPLTAMQMRLEAIQDGLVPLQEGQVEHLLKQTNVLSRLIEDLRTLSLADAGRLTLTRQKTDLSELAAEVLETFAERAQKRGVTLTLSDAPAPPVTAFVDQTRLIQVLGNLIDNALRVTPSGGVVRLGVAADGAGARLYVEDSGPGIPETDLPHIFERFVQGKDTVQQVRGSSGLGLAIVEALVRLHGGSVRAANRVDGGASFQVTLPLQGA